MTSSVVQRTACPFYGFAGMLGMFMDQEGNQCPLKDGYAPCHMEMSHEAPDWKKCSYYTPGNLARLHDLIEEAKIFPRELRPKTQREWEGIPFKDWYYHITEGEPLFGDITSD